MNESSIIGYAVIFATICLSLAMIVVLYRMHKGPSLPDRIVVLDLVASVAVGFVLMMTLSYGKTVYLNVAVTVAVIVFMGNIAFAKYLKNKLKDG